MFMSAVWHGVYAGYYLCLCSVPFYLPVEDLYDKLYRKQATGLRDRSLIIPSVYLQKNIVVVTGATALSSDATKVKKEDYDFETVHNIDPYRADFVCTFREAMKTWNMAVQYWLAVHVYKRTNKSI
ncbi:hypothetical protein J437_LFUL000641, partial [Ladona fulva]